MNSLEKLVTLYGQISDLVYDKSLFEAGVNEVEISGEKYEIIDWYDANKVFPSNGFQAILLKSNEGYTLAFRGTEPFDKMGVDIFNDLLMPIYSPQMATALIWTSQIIDKYQIDKSNLTLTGHSLGGILTQYVGSELGIKGYAYNPWGINTFFTSAGNTINYIIDRILGNIGIENKDFAKNNIYNVSYQDEGNINGDVLSNALTGIISEHIGSFIPIFGKNLGLDAHLIAPLNQAIKEYNDILKHFNPNITYKELTLAYLSTALIHKGKGYEKLNEEFKKLGVDNAAENSLSLDILTKDSSLASIFSSSSIPIENLYALINLNPFIVSGVSSKAYTELEKHKDEYSDSYITNKTKMLKLALDNKEPINGIYFKDYETNTDIDTTDDFNGIYDEYHFGTNSNDTINPIGTKISLDKNYIYALAGNDNIIAPKGDNYIEAGSGSDTIDLRNSKGNNIIYADNKNSSDGKDDGDDIIRGGEGIDTIYGGKGNDTYYVGDKDIIFDSDAKGSVVFEGVTLKGGVYDKDKGVYIDDTDNSITYRLNGDDKATLIVQKEGKSLTINNYTKSSKDLGIKLYDSEVQISVANKLYHWDIESKEALGFVMSLDRKLNKDEYLKVEVISSMNGKRTFVEFKEGDQSKEFDFTWNDDNIPQGNRAFVVSANIANTSDNLKAKIINQGSGIIKDDDYRNDDDWYHPYNPNVPDDPNDPSKAPVRYDPLIIDLNKDGTNTSKLNGAVNFDLDNNGFKEATGWINPEDAFLVYDRNNNGVIDNGGELFGDKTIINSALGYSNQTAKNGFEALKAFDTNNDNIIDARDNEFSKLLLWQDKNTNGLTEKGELFTLQDKNIKSIDLNYKEVNLDTNLNAIKQTSTVTFDDGTTTTADDVWFRVDLKITEEPNINISESIKALPNIKGFGNLHSLRNAMSMDNDLADTIRNYISLTPQEKAEQIENVIFKWAGASNIDSSSRGENIDARLLAVYEKISGKSFLQWGSNPNPTPPAADIIRRIMSKFKDYVYSSIELQTTYNGVMDINYVYFDENANNYNYDFSAFNSKLRELYDNKKYEELSILTEVVRKSAQYKPTLLDSLQKNLRNLINNNDEFAMVASSNYKKGTIENDTVNGTDESDLFIGGKGDDVFIGGESRDTYIYSRGDGRDTIYDHSYANTIYFDDINRDEVEFSTNDDSLVIDIKGTKDGINIKRIDYAYDNFSFKFADGSTLNSKDIKLFVNGDDDNNDLFGYQGDDIITGGKGDDKLSGGTGSDTYIYHKGDGNDTISDLHGVNALHFKDLMLNDLEFIRKDGNLLIKVKDNSHTITVEDILSRNAYERFNLKFADGTIVNQYDIDLKVLGSDGNDRLLGESRNDIIIGEKGDDELYGNEGSDTYIYKRGDGNDTIGEYVRDDSDYNVLHFIDMTRDNVEFSRENNNLLIKIKDNGETITTTDFFSMYGHKTAIDSFKFLDGTILSSKELKDSLLMGDDKDNHIIGYYGNDILIGGKGDDTMEGGRGNDTYIYYKGDGNDTIDKIYGNSTIDFKDLNKDDVEILSQDSNLLVRIKENNETITIKDILSSNTFYKVNLKFSNGEMIDNSHIKFNISGDDSNNILYGYDNNDTIAGGKGNDSLHGGNGIDTYIYHKGDGSDIIDDWSKENTLVFKDVSKNEVDFTASNTTDLLIKIKETGDTITLKGVLSNQGRFFNIEFSDGIRVNSKELEFNSVGDDQNNILYGFSNNDILIGGKGNDKLYGREGDDTYIYYKGDGNDYIDDWNGATTFDFKDMALGDVEFIKQNRDLLIKIKDTNEVITVANILDYYLGRKSYFKFSDGTIFENTDINLIVNGSDARDTLIGGNSNNIIDGKKGDDNLHGYDKSDTYIYRKGDGSDTINDSGGINIVDFKDLNRENVEFLGQDNGLLIKVKEDSGSIKIHQNNQSKFSFKFADGAILEEKDIEFMLIGNEENNTLYGYKGKDKLFGKEGNDKLYGGAGNDIIDGGVGNDILIGNEGSDTYLFGIGDGKDVVYALDTSSNIFSITQNGDYAINNYYNINFSQGTDIIKFKEGITKNDLTFERAGANQHDLLIKIKDSENSVAVKDMFKNRFYSIEKIEFDDGSFMSLEEIYKTTPITFLGESVIGSSYSDTIYANNNNNIIRSGYGDDVVYAKAGNDTVHGEGGNDTIEGGAGNDTLYGGDGSDIYIFGKGDGQDTIHADGKDTLKFKDGIARSDLIFSRVKSNQYESSPTDLLIKIKNTNDSITVKEMFRYDDNRSGLEKIEFIDGSSIGLEDIKKATLLGDSSSADSVINGFDTDDIIKGGSGNDIIYGKNGNDTIRSGAGADIIYGEYGNDTIEGGAGNDILYGGEGNDIYIFGRGDGEDIIHDEENSYDEEIVLNRNDVIKFKEGISINDLEFQRAGEDKEDLLIKIKDSDDSIIVKDMFRYDNNRSGINKIIFNDGLSMDYKDIVKASPVTPNLSNNSIYGSKYSDTIYGDDRDNTIYGKEEDDVIYGKAGNDKIYGGEGNDILEGETGDDDLYGGDGDDILEGGVGNDTLRGEEGSDTYIFSRGDGEDIIYSDGKDAIKFKEGVSEDDLIIARAKSNTNSLLIRIKDSTDSILVKDMFINENNTNGIKSIEFNDGSLIDYEEIKKKVLISSDPDQTQFEGFSSNDVIVGSNKDDYIYGKDGDDRLVGNKGNDTVYGGDGNDTIDAGEGDDKIDGGKGGDTYLFGRGDGQDEIENYDDSLNRMDDAIKFKEGITRDDLIFQRVRKYDDSSDFVIKIKGTEDSISVKHMFDVINNNHMLNEKFKIGKIEFSDGSSMNSEDINQALKNNNVMILDNPYWRPHEGSDENDEIYGDDDRNTLNGNKGDDILIGGKDYDELCGGEGNDTYLFGRGDGNDTIYNDDSTPNRRDIIKFKEGITADDLVFKRTNGSGRDLKIEIKGADDSITVNDMFDSENTTKHIDGVELSDGSFISLEDIKQKVLISPDSNNNTLFGFSTDDTLLGGDGNDYLNGKGGNDILKGGLGNDKYGYDYNGGYDIIEDMGGDDKLYIDISMRDLEFKKDNEDLLISVYKSPNQSIRVKNHFLADKYSIDKISFNIYDEDSFLGKDEIIKLANSIYLSSENGNKTLNGGKEDHIYTYTGGKVSISDLGGDDKVVFRLDNPGDGLFYLSNGRDLKISTNRIDDSNNDVLEIKNFFINKNAVIENFDINDHWSVTAESIFEKFGKPFPPELPDIPTPPPPSNPDNGSSGNTLTGGSEDNIFNYNGGIVSITDAGGNDKVIFTNSGSRVFYQSNGVDLKISTAKIDSSNNDILEVKNFFVNKSSIVETFQLNDYWSVTAQSIYQAFGLTYPTDNTNPTAPNPNPPSDSNNLTGGSEDNVFTYTGGKKSITDMGGNDKVIFANPGSSVYYQSNGRDLKISTAKINSSNNDVLEVKNFFIDANAIIETFQLSDYWTVTAQSIYQAFGKTYPITNETPNSEPLGLLGTPNQTDDTGLNTNTSEL